MTRQNYTSADNYSPADKNKINRRLLQQKLRPAAAGSAATGVDSSEDNLPLLPDNNLAIVFNGLALTFQVHIK